MKQLLIKILSLLVDSETKIEIKKPKINFKEGFNRIVIVCLVIYLICDAISVITDEYRTFDGFLYSLVCCIGIYFGYLLTISTLSMLFKWIWMGFTGKKRKRSLIKEWQIKFKYWNRKCERSYKNVKQPTENDNKNSLIDAISKCFTKIKNKEDAENKKDGIVSAAFGCISWLVGYEIILGLMGKREEVAFGIIYLLIYYLLLFWYSKRNSIIALILIMLANIFYLICLFSLLLEKNLFTRIMAFEMIIFIPFVILSSHLIKIAILLKQKTKEKSAFEFAKEVARINSK